MFTKIKMGSAYYNLTFLTVIQIADFVPDILKLQTVLNYEAQTEQ